MSYIGNTQQNTNYIPAVDFFNGDGVTTVFTLSRPVASVSAVQVVISNVPQNPGSAFTVLNNTITFTSAPPSGTSNIYVYYTSPNTQIAQPGQSTVGTIQIADNAITTAKIAPGAVTQSDLASGVAGNGPAFSAYGSALQSIANVTYTKINFNTKEFDTATCFDTTNYRFTPNVAGYYQLNASCLGIGSTAGGVSVSLYKNGSQVRTSAVTNSVSGTNVAPTISAVIYANGTTDYFEVYGWNNNGPLLMGSNNTLQSFSGFLARAA